MKKTTLKHMKTTPSSCLAKVSLFKEEESKTGDGEQKITISPGKVLGSPKLCSLLMIEAHGASPSTA